MNSLGTCTINYLRQLSSHPWPLSKRRWPRENLGWAAACYCVWQPSYLNALWWSRCIQQCFGPLFCVTWILGERCNDADKHKLCEVWGFSDTKEREVKEMERTELWPVLRLDITVSSIACCWKIFKMLATTATICIYDLHIIYVHNILATYIYLHTFIIYIYTDLSTYQSIDLWMIYRLAVQLHSE